MAMQQQTCIKQKNTNEEEESVCTQLSIAAVYISTPAELSKIYKTWIEILSHFRVASVNNLCTAQFL